MRKMMYKGMEWEFLDTRLFLRKPRLAARKWLMGHSGVRKHLKEMSDRVKKEKRELINRAIEHVIASELASMVRRRAGAAGNAGESR